MKSDYFAVDRTYKTQTYNQRKQTSYLISSASVHSPFQEVNFFIFFVFPRFAYVLPRFATFCLVLPRFATFCHVLPFYFFILACVFTLLFWVFSAILFLLYVFPWLSSLFFFTSAFNLHPWPCTIHPTDAPTPFLPTMASSARFHSIRRQTIHFLVSSQIGTLFCFLVFVKFVQFSFKRDHSNPGRGRQAFPLTESGLDPDLSTPSFLLSCGLNLLRSFQVRLPQRILFLLRIYSFLYFGLGFFVLYLIRVCLVMGLILSSLL